jgi:hypothetical protein
MQIYMLLTFQTEKVIFSAKNQIFCRIINFQAEKTNFLRHNFSPHYMSKIVSATCTVFWLDFVTHARCTRRQARRWEKVWFRLITTYLFCTKKTDLWYQIFKKQTLGLINPPPLYFEINFTYAHGPSLGFPSCRFGFAKLIHTVNGQHPVQKSSLLIFLN